MAVFKVVQKIPLSLERYVSEGKYHDVNAIEDVLQYVLHPMKTPHHLVGGFGVNPEAAAEQMTAIAVGYQKTTGIRLRHMILSFEKKERVTPQRAAYLAYQIAAYYGNMYQIVFAVHEDRPQVHIHFVMNTVCYLDGHKYEGQKSDYYQFQHYVKTVLWKNGEIFLHVVAD